MLGGVDLNDWAEEGDLVRAEIRLLPVVQRLAADPAAADRVLGHDLALRLRAFEQNQELGVEALRSLFADLKAVDPASVHGAPADTSVESSKPAAATIDRIPRVDW
jgi:hypothetical protein